MQSRPFDLSEVRPRFPHYENLPKRNARRRFALRITLDSGGRLPLWRPADVAAAFGEHEGLCGVGLNWRIALRTQEGVRVWWLMFRDYETMDAFYKSMDGQVFEGMKIRVVPDFEMGVYPK